MYLNWYCRFKKLSMSQNVYNNGLKLLFFEAISHAKKNNLTEVTLLDVSKQIAEKNNINKLDFNLLHQRVYFLARSFKKSGLIMLETKIIEKKQVCIIHI